jgi:hypothetical protein
MRELRKLAAYAVSFILIAETGQFLAHRDFSRFLWATAMLLVLSAVAAAFYAWWRVPHLRSVFFRFDGTELIYDFEHDRRELLATDVVSFVSTPRLIHIVSKRPRYTVTIHSELDRFEELRSALAPWLPATAAPWAPSQPPTLLRRCLGAGIAIVMYALTERYRDRPESVWVLLTGLVLLQPVLWYRFRRKSSSSIPAPPSHLVP